MNQQNTEEKIREHSYDGIQEFDKSLPNWWLFTLYATIVFSVAYWAYYQKTDLGMSQQEQLAAALADIEENVAQAKAEAGVIDDDSLRSMSSNSEIVAAGQQVYAQSCASCHGANLEGGIGLALNDDVWKHGSNPLAIKAVVADGVAAAGMPPWGPVLGEEKVNQVVAYILSH